MNGKEIMDLYLKHLKKASEYSIEHWTKYEVNTWRWWLNISLWIIPLIIWWRLVDKKRIFEILFLGSMISLLSIFADIYGSELVTWAYMYRVVPNIPRLIPIDIGVMPVGYMIIYQYFPRWKEYSIAVLILALLYTIVGETLMIYLDLYKLYTWRIIYSFPIYIIFGIIAKLVVNWLIKVKEKAK